MSYQLYGKNTSEYRQAVSAAVLGSWTPTLHSLARI